MEHLATVTLDTMFANFPLELESCSSLDSFEDAQVEPLSGAVKPADRKACSSSCQRLPTEAPRPPAVPTVAWEDDSTEKHTQGRKSKKESIQTQEETQVCAFVPEDPSQELPHTSGVDPTGTDPRESEPTDKKGTKWRKFLAGLRRAWKSIKGSFQTQEETQVCAFVPEDPSQELPHTSGVDPTGTDPQESEPTDRSFESLYDVVKKLKSRRGVSYHLGFRNSDDKRVLIKFIKKNRPEKLVELPGYSNPLSQEAAAMLMVQKPPTSEHLVQLYDHFVMEDQDILIMEYPRSYISLFDYVQRNSSNLTETEVKLIIQGLIVALHHCMSRGVYRRTHMKNILVHTNTLHVKLMDFGGALLVEERRDDEPLLISAIRKYAEWATTEDLRILLDLMVPRITRCFWMRPRVSKECLDLLEHLHDVKSRMTLQAMLKHDWFKRKTEA
ncbi:serine/threonine-protein kinase pim-1-like isoform X1 [Megalobrama amblycephala]|uniref:serine/threonine-protein kinase pim-1-like isoform X1 n=1 Tax=Megalobrama amblycephala TaxID=75352 RepID=UPI002014057E|nr:serine/threonine-protein kinase pim-1-like isoform X1 [Megalobrama amblycephala]XP_048008630.1 serine/threonine-protein kinase pim-1-like isoform X1 [Megalobrama amblycephala]